MGFSVVIRVFPWLYDFGFFLVSVSVGESA